MATRDQPLQTSFTSGVLSPRLAARTDIEHYWQGASIGQQVLFAKEGGARGRWGLQHLADVPADGRLLGFSFNTEQNYLLYAGLSQIRFYRNDALVTNINGTGNPYLVTTLTLAQCLELDVTQSADTMILAHVDVAPQQLQRGTAHNLWTLGAATLVNLPKYDFADADSPTPTSHVVDIAFASFVDGDRYKLELNDHSTPEIIYATSGSAAGQAANIRRIREQLLALPDTGFDESSITVAYTGSSTYRVTFAGDSADAYEPMSGRNTDTTDATITCTTITTGVPRRENVISATRGWPRCVAFYEGRLLFGGLASLPQTLLGSIIGGFNPYNFKIGDGLDDQGIFITLNTNQVNEIRAIYPGRQLQVFTSGGEFYSPDRPITPLMSLPQQSSFGCAEFLPPVEVDGATIYVTRQRKTLREYLYLDKEQAYNASSLTVMASHLHAGIRSMGAQTSTEDDEDSYVVTLNADGTGAILNTLRSQEISAWSELFTRPGDELRQVQVVGDAIYFLVKRQRNGATVYTIEKASFDTRMDASLKITSGPWSTAMGGFEHLAGEEVDVLVDGAPVGKKTVSASGVITLTHAPTVSIEAGYFVPPVLATMSLEAKLRDIVLLGATKSLTEIRVKVRHTLGLIANGEQIPDTVPGEVMTSTPLEPFSGVVSVGAMGWTDQDVIITLTQSQPLPFHILAVSGVLKIGKA